MRRWVLGGIAALCAGAGCQLLSGINDLEVVATDASAGGAGGKAGAGGAAGSTAGASCIVDTKAELVKTFSSPDHESIHAATSFATGGEWSVAVAGLASGTSPLDFGAGPVLATRDGGSLLEIWRARYAGDLSHRASQRLGGLDAKRVRAIAGDSTGASYLAGEFAGSFDEPAIVATGISSGYVIRFDPDGSLGLGYVVDAGNVAIGAMVVLPDAEQILIAGTYDAPWPRPAIPPASPAGRDVLLANLSLSTSSFAWARGFGNSSPDDAAALALGLRGTTAVVVAGTFAGTFAVGAPVTPLQTEPTDSGDGFVMSLPVSPTDPPSWGQQFGGAGLDYANDIEVGSDDTIFVSGVLGGAGGGLYLASYASNGAVLWQKLYGAEAVGSAKLALGPGGELVVVGRFQNAIDFGCGKLTASNVGHFVAGVDRSTGEVQWASLVASGGSTATPTEYERPSHFVEIAPDGRIFLMGSFSGTLDVAEPSIQASGYDAFLAVIAR